MSIDYWKECITEAFEDAEIKATDEQIDNVTCWVEGAHDNYSLGTGEECIPNPLKLECENLKRELRAEINKVICEKCAGSGMIANLTSDCWRCRGEGRY